MLNVKSTGIIRRIDDLGRVVVPKEIRRKLNIREGDLIEISVTEDSATFRKYSVFGKLAGCGNLLEGMYRLFKCPVLLCSRDQVADAFGIPKEQYEKRVYSKEFLEWMETQDDRIIEKYDPIPVINGSEMYADIALPIRAYGDMHGAIVMLMKKDGKPSDVSRAIRMTCVDLVVQSVESMLEAV